MGEHLLKNWIIYVMIGGFIWFIVYAYIGSRGEDDKGDEQNRSKDKGRNK